MKPGGYVTAKESVGRKARGIKMGNIIISAGVLSMLSVTVFAAPQEQIATPNAKQQAVLNLAKQVRKQIVTQPQYGVFDNIHFGVQGNTVILRGQASRPTLKPGIERSANQAAPIIKAVVVRGNAEKQNPSGETVSKAVTRYTVAHLLRPGVWFVGPPECCD